MFPNICGSQNVITLFVKVHCVIDIVFQSVEEWCFDPETQIFVQFYAGSKCLYSTFSPKKDTLDPNTLYITQVFSRLFIIENHMNCHSILILFLISD